MNLTSFLHCLNDPSEFGLALECTFNLSTIFNILIVPTLIIRVISLSQHSIFIFIYLLRLYSTSAEGL